MTEPFLTCPCCGSDVDCTELCEECGCVIGIDDLVSSGPLPSAEFRVRSNTVTEGDDGTGLLASTCGRSQRQSESGRRLQTQAACAASELGLPITVTNEVSKLLEIGCPAPHLTTADIRTASAVLLYIGARLDRFPVTLRTLCAGLSVAFCPAAKLFTRIARTVPGKLPPVPVRSYRSIA
jgi:hypothetical protein